ncbi:malto-oligosyltrehalose trehalohydrolase [Occallatibacter riparius]|uniref:Malto-oligosyltrehalose trehalohydrolase n=1 Tax=Occallatibacter riparius TaxID=1002689 RepID=A0A9J7BYK5_9BACT|nr:malto-oligosyltrehalose trehalohydrolase [Occallatibacter riparius]UWZ86557.1 malto-oligosyltrehalose trehalohydrolase [Occallatibacter riparius]
MHRFKVWAPLANKMLVEADGVRAAMQGPDKHGWWTADVEAAGPGTKYGFVIDDDARAYPDPRSLWQPDGVHGLSRVYDQHAFAWSDAGFEAPPLASAIVYELHIGTFTQEGTLDAAIGKLDALKELGITHVELMPVNAFAGHHGWGYDGVALFAVYEPYGGPDALKRFVDAAHAKGLAVLLDVVYNHFGPVGNYTGKYGPYVTEAHHTPWGGAVNLEGPWSHEVRRFFLDNALMWMRDFHIDGLRLDAVHAYVDRSAIHFLEQLAFETEALEAETGRQLVLIAESDLNDPRFVSPHEAGGYGMDAQWSDDFHHALFTVLLPGQGGYYDDFGSMGQLKKALEETFVYDGVCSKHRRRVHGKPARHLSQHKFLGFIQNHDQIGNRAVGDRVHEAAGFARAKVAAALVMTAPFVPMIFQGEEWAASSPFQYFADHDDPKMARMVSEGRKREFAAFGWDPKDVPDPEKKETFERSKLKWDEIAQGQHAEMLAWYRNLIRTRRTTPDLNVGHPGNTRVVCSEEGKWLEMRRGAVRVFCNLGDGARSFTVRSGARVLVHSGKQTELQDQALLVGADGVAVVLEE